MTAMEWVEVRGKTVEDAVSIGLQELGLDSPDAAQIEIIQQPQRGFLGIGGQDAIVSIKPRPKRRRRRRRPRGDGESAGKAGQQRGEASGGQSGARSRGRSRRTRESGEEKTRGVERGRAEAEGRRRRSAPPEGEGVSTVAEPGDEEQPPVAVEEQARIVQDFLVGLVEAFGLEGEVSTRVEGDIIYADIAGDQTEALIGPKGSVLDAVLELCRTIVHRQSQAGARLRLDIGGYGERRREALRIYAGRLAARVLEEGGEVMLEPMNAADRKVVHDVVSEIAGVRTFSEGEEPSRSVVIARVEEG
jgi:spoIIIJ-associated protein